MGGGADSLLNVIMWNSGALKVLHANVDLFFTSANFLMKAEVLRLQR
jgi:hypothetical protein